MELKNFRDIQKGSLKCTFTVCITEWGNIEIDAAFFEKQDGQFWVSYASKEYISKDGTKKNYSLVRFPKPVKEKLDKAIQQKVKANEKLYAKAVFGQEPGLKEEEIPF